MRYLAAAITCFVLVLLYAIVGVLLGWKHGGGAIPMLMLCAAISATWIGITRHTSRGVKQASPSTSPERKTSPPDSASGDQSYYDTVADELRTEQLVAGTWARAFADSSGSLDQARALYIRYRVSQLTEAAKREQHELRQATNKVSRQRMASGVRRFFLTLLAAFCGLFCLFFTTGIAMVLFADSSEGTVGWGIFYLIFAVLSGWAAYGCFKASNK